MKRLAFLLVAVLIGTTVAMAQNRGGQRQFDPEEMAKRQTEQFKTELELNDTQAEKMEKVLLKSYNEMTALRQEMTGEEDRTKMREKMTEWRANQQKELKKILTDEQFAKYEKLMEERRANRRGRPGGGRQ
jgi:Spy/CpxP family protein refolding chaperone